MFELNKVHHIHFELTNNCQAACPGCARNQYGKTNSWLKPSELKLEDIKRIMGDSKLLFNSNNILYCGNYGDPILASEILDIIEWFQEQPCITKRFQTINTNAGSRNEEFWTKLAQLFPKDDPRGIVTFSVDGLQDTNHYYRRQVSWKRVWENMNTYINAGGNAVWDFLVFGHNKHQLQEAQEIADNFGIEIKFKRPLGFDISGGGLGERRTMPVYDRHGNYEFSLVSAEDEEPGPIVEEKLKGRYNQSDIRDPVFEPTTREVEFSKKSCIKCKSLGSEDWNTGTHNIYVTSDGTVLPCCFMHGVFHNPAYNFSSYQLKKAVNLKDFDTKINSIDSIVQSDAMKETFFDPMSKESLLEGKLGFCIDHCGDNNPMDLLYNTNYREK